MKVLIAMSGGIDSSMSAKFLLESGYELIGCYMKLHNNDDYHKENIAKVSKISDFLGIQTQILDLRDKFKEQIYDLFVDSYKKGLTPNPCVHCNRLIKFGALWQYAKGLGCEKIATGHYARIENGLLKAGADESKDQSYFLANLNPNIISHIIFPLGNKFKQNIKAQAMEIPQFQALATQKESSEICFVPTNYMEILNRHFNTDQKGIVRNTQGEIVGEHNGYMNFTIGKRRGFTYNGAHEPHFVTAINPAKNEIIVGLKDELKTYNFQTTNFNDFIGLGDFEAFVKVRYRSNALPCFVKKQNDGGVSVELFEPAFGVASGQLAVFYDENKRVLGSGFIK